MYIKVSWVRNHTSRSTGQTFQIQGAYNYQGNFPFLGQLLLLLCFCFFNSWFCSVSAIQLSWQLSIFGSTITSALFLFFNSWFCSVSAIQLSWQLSIFRSTIGSTIGLNYFSTINSKPVIFWIPVLSRDRLSQAKDRKMPMPWETGRDHLFGLWLESNRTLLLMGTTDTSLGNPSYPWTPRTDSRGQGSCEGFSRVGDQRQSCYPPGRRAWGDSCR